MKDLSASILASWIMAVLRQRPREVLDMYASLFEACDGEPEF